MEETLDAIRNLIGAAHLDGAGAVLLLLALVVLLVTLWVHSLVSAGEQQVAGLSAQLAYQQAVTRWLMERLRQLMQQVEGLAGATERPAGRLRLDQDGTLWEDDRGPAV